VARFKTGIEELNSITGGLPTPCVILVEGKPGAGKSLFALQCIATEGHRVVVLTNNPPKEVQDELAHEGVKLDAQYIDCYSWLAGGASAVDSLSNLSKLLVVIEDALKKGSLVVLDSLTPLILYNREDAVERFLEELTAMVKAKECVAFLTLDLGSFHPDAENTFEALVDGVFLLDKEQGLKVKKLRDTRVADKWFFYEVTDAGVRLRAGGAIRSTEERLLPATSVSVRMAEEPKPAAKPEAKVKKKAAGSDEPEIV
jgi:KaiC/GvpD/RAD55 family RecA-like ATPase